MADPDVTVFLSYRREVSWPLAHAVRGELVPHGFDVFVDTQNIDSGEFERVILHQIEARAHFLLLLEPRSLDRISEPGDWLRRETAHALSLRRNVVPLLANGARMPAPADLPADLARLPSFNAVSVPHDYFAEAMQKLRDRFLRPPDPVPPPAAGGTAMNRLIARALGLPPAAALGRPVLREVRKVRRPLLVGVSWSAVDGATSYDIEQSSTADFVQGQIVYLRGDATTYDLLRSELDRGRFFRVRAVGREGFDRGPWSNVVEVH